MKKCPYTVLIGTKLNLQYLIKIIKEKQVNKLQIALMVFLLLAIGVSQSNTQGKESEETKVTNENKAVYTCPMHPEVTSEKSGTCPKCGMELVLREDSHEAKDSQRSEITSPGDKIQQARSLLLEAKKEFAQDGKYNCCIKDPCDRCALDHGSCPCADDVKAGKAVCSDCYAGWQRGDGIVPGVKASKVKGSFHGHKH